MTIFPNSYVKANQGFTLVELMITLVVSSIIGICAFAAYSTQSKSFTTQREIARIQQDLRGAMYLMGTDLFNAGRDPNLSNQYGITDTRYYGFSAIDNVMAISAFTLPVPPATNCYTSYPVIEFSSLRFDNDSDGIGDTRMDIRYQVYDFNNDGRLDLGRRIRIDPIPVLGNPELIAEGVVAIGFAFAYNPNPNGKYRMARSPALNSVIWAIDSDGDGRLDMNIDWNGDGEITTDDDTDGNGVITNLDGDTSLPPPDPAHPIVTIGDAVAVRIWLLLQSERESPENMVDNNFYGVGNRIIPPPANFNNGFNDRFKRRLETVTVALRNFHKS
jgi:prepilin-type N-terminal cleavage/methylation domain-containing protein